MVMKNEAGGEGYKKVVQVLSAIAAIEGCFKFAF
jgi:hypothetical protein